MDFVIFTNIIENEAKNFQKVRTFEIKPFILAQDLQLKIKQMLD
jgi:hypothetical protein